MDDTPIFDPPPARILWVSEDDEPMRFINTIRVVFVSCLCATGFSLVYLAEVFS